MAKRIYSAAVGIVIFFGVFLFWDTWLLNVCTGAIVFMCIYEIAKATGCIKNKPLFILSEIFAVGITLFYNISMPLMKIFMLLFIFLLFLMLLAKHRELRIEQVSIMFLFCMMIPYFMGSILLLRDTEFGQFLVYLPFVAAWLTDTGAYFVGMKFGKHKLAPEISPKKTVEGAIGGILGGILGCSVYALLVTISGQVKGVLWPNLILLAVILSVIDQFGDLSFSIIKREFKAKDYGNIMPGHGGVLDRFDGVLFVAPAALLLLKIMDIFIGAGI